MSRQTMGKLLLEDEPAQQPEKTPVQQELIQQQEQAEERLRDCQSDVLAELPRFAGELGWNPRALQEAVAAAGGDDLLSYRLFPGGISDAVEAWCQHIDDAMLLACSAEKLGAMKVRERIATLLKERFRIMQPHKAAVKNLLGYFALPWNAAEGAHRLASAADAMWQAAGDTSTDFNYYTKRGLLAAVYSGSLFYWLQLPDDGSEAELHSFIDRRIDEVMQIPHYKKTAEERISSIFPWPDLIRQAFTKES